MTETTTTTTMINNKNKNDDDHDHIMMTETTTEEAEENEAGIDTETTTTTNNNDDKTNDNDDGTSSRVDLDDASISEEEDDIDIDDIIDDIDDDDIIIGSLPAAAVVYDVDDGRCIVVSTKEAADTLSSSSSPPVSAAPAESTSAEASAAETSAETKAEVASEVNDYSTNSHIADDESSPTTEEEEKEEEDHHLKKKEIIASSSDDDNNEQHDEFEGEGEDAARNENNDRVDLDDESIADDEDDNNVPDETGLLLPPPPPAAAPAAVVHDCFGGFGGLLATTNEAAASSAKAKAATTKAKASSVKSQVVAMIMEIENNDSKISHNNTAGESSSSKTEEEDDDAPSSADDECHESVRSLFHKAYLYLNPSAFFRFVVYLYAERKIMVFYWLHFIATMIIWIHFFIMKYEQQKENVPEDAAYYYWKRLVPPLEFGSMHAILFQMGLIPLTMCRYSIAALSDTNINNYFPFNRIISIHIYLGYVMIFIVITATIFFITFFGVLCGGGEQEFCDKFTSEIMITGYCILGVLLTIGITSSLRHYIPYEVFYYVHQIVFVLYALVIVHTLDIAQRNGTKQRSQTFKWFAVSFLYYICDRLAMHFHHTYRTKLLECSAVRGSGGGSEKNANGQREWRSTADPLSTRMLILKLKRPPLFFFRPGQYALLKVNSIDKHNWHPFSIASGPNSPFLEFYIEVFGNEGSNTWTEKLWSLLEGRDTSCGGPSIEFQVRGPCGGTGLLMTRDYSHALAIGTGTGIVPILSLLQQHVRHLLRLAPDAHSHDLQDFRAQVNLVENAEEENIHKGSMIRQIYDGCTSGCRNKDSGSISKFPYKSFHNMGPSRTDSLRNSIRRSVMYRDEEGTNLSVRELQTNLQEFHTAACQTTRSFYGVVLLGIMPVAGVGLIGFTISWNTINVEIPFGCLEFLQACTIIFQIAYAIIALLIWDANNFFAYTDAAVVLLFPFVDWYWVLQYQRNGVLLPPDITTYCLLIAYMTIQTWNKAVKPCTTKSWQKTGFYRGLGASSTLERLDVVWVTRESSLVSKILPEVNQLFEDLINSWGLERARSVCRFYVFVTDDDVRATRSLKRAIAGTCLCKQGMVRFCRPDIGKMIEDHSIEMICTRRSSYSLLAYVGSPDIASEIHECKLFNDMKVAITGNKKHQMEFVSESYGGVTKAKHSATVPIHDLQNQMKKLNNTAAVVNGCDDNGDSQSSESQYGERGDRCLI